MCASLNNGTSYQKCFLQPSAPHHLRPRIDWSVQHYFTLIPLLGHYYRCTDLMSLPISIQMCASLNSGTSYQKCFSQLSAPHHLRPCIDWSVQHYFTLIPLLGHYYRCTNLMSLPISLQMCASLNNGTSYQKCFLQPSAPHHLRPRIDWSVQHYFTLIPLLGHYYRCTDLMSLPISIQMCASLNSGTSYQKCFSQLSAPHHLRPCIDWSVQHYFTLIPLLGHYYRCTNLMSLPISLQMCASLNSGTSYQKCFSQHYFSLFLKDVIHHSLMII